MTTLAEQMAADLDILFNLDDFAQAVTYDNGTELSILAIVDREAIGGQNAEGASVTVKRSDVAAPSYRDKFTIGGEVWRVAMDGSRPLIKGDDHIWIIQVVKGERNTAWRT